jgi:putative hydrolase of the HAD superfamily
VRDETWVVWCDFGGVLTEPMPDVLDRFARAAEVPVQPLLAAFDTVAARYGMKELEPLERGLLTEADWGRQISDVLAPGWRPRVDLTLFGEIWYADRTFNTPLFQHLAARSSSSVRLGLLTNSVREWEVHRARIMPNASIFAAMIKSHEVGVCKPAADIYFLAEQAMPAEPAHCVLIDDMPVNCAAAQARGWSAIRHRSNEQTIAELNQILGGYV